MELLQQLLLRHSLLHTLLLVPEPPDNATFAALLPLTADIITAPHATGDLVQQIQQHLQSSPPTPGTVAHEPPAVTAAFAALVSQVRRACCKPSPRRCAALRAACCEPSPRRCAALRAACCKPSPRRCAARLTRGPDFAGLSIAQVGWHACFRPVGHRSTRVSLFHLIASSPPHFFCAVLNVCCSPWSRRRAALRTTAAPRMVGTPLKSNAPTGHRCTATPGSGSIR